MVKPPSYPPRFPRLDLVGIDLDMIELGAARARDREAELFGMRPETALRLVAALRPLGIARLDAALPPTRLMDARDEIDRLKGEAREMRRTIKNLKATLARRDRRLGKKDGP